MHAHYDYDCPTLRSCCGNLEVQIVAQTRVLEAAARALVLGLPLPLKLNRHKLFACATTLHVTHGRFPAAAARCRCATPRHAGRLTGCSGPIRACVCNAKLCSATAMRASTARLRKGGPQGARKRRGWRAGEGSEGDAQAARASGGQSRQTYFARERNAVFGQELS
jgi:hypothetical protein